MIDFRHTIIIMTSNAGDETVHTACLNGRPPINKINQLIYPQLLQHFKPAFLGRTTIIPYFPLNHEEMYRIIQLSLSKIEQRIVKQYTASFEYDQAVILLIIKMNQSPETGARAVEQIIYRHLIPEIANRCIFMLSHQQSIHHIHIKVVDNQFAIDVH